MDVGPGVGETLLRAADANGCRRAVTLVPDAANAARVRRKTSFSGVYEASPRRRADRRARALQALSGRESDAAPGWDTTQAERRRIGELIVRATEAIVIDAEQAQGSARWRRHRSRATPRCRHGLTVDVRGLPLLPRGTANILVPPSPA